MSKHRERYLRETLTRYYISKEKWPELWTPQAQRMLEDLQKLVNGIEARPA